MQEEKNMLFSSLLQKKHKHVSQDRPDSLKQVLHKQSKNKNVQISLKMVGKLK